MLERQMTMNVSGYSNLYDLIVPEDHFLRQINGLMDFTFIYENLKDKYCHDNGRNAVHPIRMFKYLFLKTTYQLSDKDLVARARVDMSFKYFLELAPEDDVIDSSTLAHFRKQRVNDDDFLDFLIDKTVQVAYENKVLQSSTLIVDSTHTKSKYNHVTPQEVLRSRSKNLRKAVYAHDESMKKKMPSKPKEDTVEAEIEYTQKVMEVVESQSSLSSYPKVQESLNLLKETVEDDLEHLQLSQDPDAKVGHKSADSSFFGYKTHLGMSEERIITAATTTTGEKSDGKYLQSLIEKSKKSGMDVDTVIGDAAYSEKKNLIYANDHEVTLISRLNSSITHGTRKKDQTFEFNKDAGMYVCPAGHMATHKRKDSRKASGNKSERIRYFFDIDQCKTCPLREGCYQDGAKSKTYTVTIQSHQHQEQAEFQETEAFKEQARQRYKIEAKNSELKHRHGYDIASSSGLKGMELQAAMAIFTVNIKRILKLMEK